MTRQLYIKDIPGKGRGVFCTEAISKDEVFEISALIVLPARDYDTACASRLGNYFFNFNREKGTLALALGFGSLYNHKTDSNASYCLDMETETMEYYALEDIPPHTEICINYSGESGREFTEWFEARDIRVK